jgi:hypothetical protein
MSLLGGVMTGIGMDRVIRPAEATDFSSVCCEWGLACVVEPGRVPGVVSAI